MAIRRIVNLPSIDKKKADILNNGIVTPETITDKYGDTKDGELFINKNVDNELLIAKNADGNYIAFEPSKAIDGKFDEVNKRIDGVDDEINGIKSDYIKNISVNGSEGTVSANIASVTLDADDVKVGAEIKINDTVISDETSITVKGSIENIANEIVKNEQTTSGALNDLDGRVKTIENAQIKDVQVNNISVVDADTKIAKIDLSEYAKGDYLSADTQYLSNITTSGEGNVVKEISQDGKNVKVVYGEAGTEVTINEIGAGNVITGITAEGMTVTVNRGQITTPEGGEENVINEIKVNNTPLKPDENKSVNIDLSGYQPKGNYLTSVPSEYANKIEIVKVNGTALNIDTSDKSVNVPIQDYTPTIGENGNWFIGGNDTNVKAKGENGQSAKITGATATATTIAAGTNATVNVKSIGEDLSRGFEFTFEIPKGEKGDPGAKGEKGEDGKSVNIKDSKADCTIIGSDAYVALDESDNQYHLYILKSGSGETGEYRDVGQFAIKGPQGNSVTGITTENITNGTRITFVDSEGKNLTGTVDVINGTNGKNGTPGANGDSITGITSNNVSDGVQVSFRTTNTTNPVIGSVTIPSGKPGTDGLSVTRTTTATTSDGNGTIITFKNNNNVEIGSVTVLNGNDGAPGKDGKDGLSITAATTASTDGGTIVSFENANGPIGTVTVLNGKDGKDGAKGETGESITKVEETIYGLNHTITFYAGDNNPLEKTITIKDGESGEPGSNGSDGESASITGASATTTTLGAGEKATAEVSLTGGELSRGFNFTFGIPKGEKGEPGQTGPAGPSANAQISGGTCYLMGLTSTTGDIVSTKTNASCFMSGGSLYSQNKEVLTAVTVDNHYDPSKNTPFITSGDTSKYINAISFDSNGHVTNIQTANTSDFVSNDTEYKSLSAQVITNKDNIETLSGSVTAFSSSVVTNIEAINKNITTANTLYFIGKSSPANESLGTTNLFVASGAYITNSEFYGSAFYETSDERLKYFTSDVNVDFDKLKSIPKKYFMWKNREMNPTNIGTSAQKLQAVYPELVSESEGYLRVDYAKLSVIALAAVDKLHEENEELKERLKKIEEKLGL